MNAGRRPEWLQAYQAALLEVDRIKRAYAAMQVYRHEAVKNNSDIDHEALSDALSNLRVLKREAGLPVNDPDEEKGPETTAPDH